MTSCVDVKKAAFWGGFLRFRIEPLRPHSCECGYLLGEHLLLRCGGDGLRCGQQLADSLELFVAGEVDRELAFAFGRLSEIHFGAERSAELLLE